MTKMSWGAIKAFFMTIALLFGYGAPATASSNLGDCEAHDGVNAAREIEVFKRRVAHHLALQDPATLEIVLEGSRHLSLNYLDVRGFSPLHYAATIASDRFLELCLSHPGTDPNIIAGNGMTPFLVARRHFRYDNMRLLLPRSVVPVKMTDDVLAGWLGDPATIPAGPGPAFQGDLPAPPHYIYEWDQVISEIAPGLFLSGEPPSRHPQALARHGITHVLSLCNASAYGPRLESKQFVVHEIAMEDTLHEDLLSKIPAIVGHIAETIARGHKILVHCRMGYSRSAAGVIAYWMVTHQKTFEDALLFVRSKRPVVSPNDHFSRQLLEFEQSEQFQTLRCIPEN